MGIHRCLEEYEFVHAREGTWPAIDFVDGKRASIHHLDIARNPLDNPRLIGYILRTLLSHDPKLFTA